MIAVQINQEESKHAIAEFNNNIFSKQVSNVIFKEDSFIKFVTNNVCIVNLNSVIPIRTFLAVIGIIATLICLFFYSRFNALATLTITMYIYYFAYNYLFYILFKKGLRKAGYKGKIKLL